MSFDPDAAGKIGSGIFGLPNSRDDSHIIILPVPFDATTSYGHGTHRGPEAVYNASMQVDLYDRRFGRIYEKGIFLEHTSDSIRALSEQARRLALPIIEKGGADDGDVATIEEVNAAGEKVNGYIYEETRRTLAEGKVPALLGGDHSTPFGAILACAERAHEVGILQFDAHMDFREAYEGFKWSHASIMYNVLLKIPQVTKLVQVGIRDFGEGEMDFGIEIALSRLAAKEDWAKEYVKLEGVTHVLKEEKRGFKRGMVERLKMYGHMIKWLFKKLRV